MQLFLPSKYKEDLQYAQVGLADYEKLAIRIAIVGDILHQDNDIFGDSVNLRPESSRSLLLEKSIFQLPLARCRSKASRVSL